ncbi:hypothetical protein ASG11_04025 [Sphingomonas sp. Leaf357]|nr:hypothetical protein ASG11_04025 [Sphingomonas sp. Leaf357]
MLGSAAAPASATTINFDVLPGGAPVADMTPISTQYASLGVVFSAVLGNDTSVLPVATSYAAGPAGPNYSGNFLGNAPNGAPFTTVPVFQVTPRYDILRLTFAGGANNVSLSLNNFSLVGRTTFNAYDANGLLLQSFTTNAGNGWEIRSLSVNNVARLDLLNNVFNGSPTFFGIDQLNYTLNASAVPETATWGMMILGFGMIGAVARSRKIRTTVRFA